MFAGFLFSSVFKGLFSAPIDLTFLFMALTILIVLARLFKKSYVIKKIILPLAIFIALTLIMLFSYIYSPSDIYAQSKIVKFITITMWSYFGVFFIIKDKNTLDSFIKGLLFYGLLTTLFVFYDFARNGMDFFRIGVGDGDGEKGGNILGLGRLTGVTAIILIVRGFYEKPNKVYKLMYFVLLAITVFVLMLTSARMALLALLAAVVLLFAISFKFNFKLQELRISKGLLSLVLLFPFLVIGLYLTNAFKYFDVMLRRVTTIFTQEGGGASVSSRTNMYDIAIDMWKDAPFFGQGIGSYAINYLGLDSRAYPHNIFLEFLSELGLVGLLLFVALFLITLKPIISVLKRGANNQQIIVIMSLVFVLLNVNSSGDINDNRWIFSFLALAYLFPLYSKEIEIKKEEVNLNRSA